MRTSARIRALARRLRREMTPPEVRLWMRLRGVRPRFRRQHPIGGYVLDFFAPAAGLVVEVDGSFHDFGGRIERDASRDGWLAARGLLVLRVAARDVMEDVDGVADGVVRLAVERVAGRCAPPPPAASRPPPP